MKDLHTFFSFPFFRELESTYIPRVPKCLSPRRNWPPTPPRKRVCPPPPEPKEGGTPFWGSPNSDDWRKSQALCLHCVSGIHTNSKHYMSRVSSLIWSSCKIHIPWMGDIVDSGIGWSYRPASLCSLVGRYDNPMLESTLPSRPPIQGLWF
jgi:hypothetical protein